MEIINLGILKSPLSWLTIFLMVLIAGIAFHLICDSFGVHPVTGTDSENTPVQ